MRGLLSTRDIRTANTPAGLLGIAPPPVNRNTVAPAVQQATPERRRAGFLSFLLGGTEGRQAEQDRLDSEPLREASRARMLRLQSYVDTLDPSLQLAYEANREALGEAFASRGEAVTLDQGDVRMVGDRVVYGAPFEAAPGSTIFDPTRPGQAIARAPSEAKVAGGALVAPDGTVLYRGPQVESVAATADAFVTPEIAQGQGGGAPRIVRSSRPETVTIQPGGEAITLGADGRPVNRVASTQQRPMSDADQAAIARAESNLASIGTATARAQNILAQIEGGELNLGPLTNTISGVRNLTGQSSQNSLNYEALMNWAKEARDAILSANTGVQTDQDAVRALDRIISSPNDENVVKQSIQRFIEANAATAEVMQRDIARRGGQAPAPASPSPQISREAAIAELRRRGRI